MRCMVGFDSATAKIQKINKNHLHERDFYFGKVLLLVEFCIFAE